MHMPVREAHSLDEGEQAVDLELDPAPLVLLSFSDSDLAAMAQVWQRWHAAQPQRPPLRLVNLQRLRHPMSVDVFVEQVIDHAQCVLIRLLGGINYWRYGIEECASLCRIRQSALAIIPGDGRDEPRFGECSTVCETERHALSALFDAGGAENLGAVLEAMAALAHKQPPCLPPPQALPMAGEHTPLRRGDAVNQPLALIVFYRSYRLADDLQPIEALADALAERGLAVRGLYVTSLKEPQSVALLQKFLGDWPVRVVLNATGFAARRGGEDTSPLDAAGVPVLQLILANCAEPAWRASERGVSQSDLAMQVVLPELDGRLLTSAISCKAQNACHDTLQYQRSYHRCVPQGIQLAAERAAAWVKLNQMSVKARRIAVVLSDYPGAAGQAAHAVGLDALASLEALLHDLSAAGYTCTPYSARDLAEQFCRAAPRPILSLADYRSAFAALPATLQTQVLEAWGPVEEDPALQDGAWCLRHLHCGHLLLAIQPERGTALERKSRYHDLSVPPRHAYIAFYIAVQRHADALLHFGTHGTLEWLPGKAAALAETCWPRVLLGALPVIYPFIVNNPGEAAAAKRRLGAVTLGHLTPPLARAGSHGAVLELERLIDEYAAADGLDARRMRVLQRDILQRSAALGLLQESGAEAATTDDDKLATLDAWLCDVKDLQIRDGLHIYGRPPRQSHALIDALQRSCPEASKVHIEQRLHDCAQHEREALLAALDGRFIAPGAAGAPTRGRLDVLPTGRNLYTIDPRAVPTRSALVLAQRQAEQLLDDYLQRHGDWPRSWLIDLWGSTTMRTGGEDLALGLILLGVEPKWDEGSNRVNGFEVLPLSRLGGRPRADVTLRISGLFRDAFEAQIALFDAAVRAVAACDDEPEALNPLAAATRGLKGAAFRQATVRIYGSAPGDYGAGLDALLARGSWQARDELAEAYLNAGAHHYGQELNGQCDRDGFAQRVAATDAFVHQQDHAETDLLEDREYAAFEGGFAAAATALGQTPTLYHHDTSQPEAPKVRTVHAEVCRVVRARVANPRWLEGMRRHGYRGAAEISRAVDALAAFAATLPQRLDRQFDQVFDATLNNADLDAFLQRENPEAREAIRQRLDEMWQRGLWQPRGNRTAAVLSGEGID